MELRRLLIEVLESEGFRVDEAPPLEGRSGATYPASLIAEREDGFFLVDTLGSRSVTPHDLEALASIVEDTRVDGAILFALDGLAPETDPGALEHVRVWDEARTKQAIGTQLLSWIETEDEVLETIGPTSPKGPTDHEAPEAQVEATPTESEHEPATHTLDAETDRSQNGATETPMGDESTPALPNVQADMQDTEAPGDGDAEILTDEPAEPDTQPEQEPATADAVADDGSDAEILTDDAPAKEPAAADPSPQQAPASGPDASENGGQFVSPEEMARRAKEMLDKGEIPEDGDAEIIVEDDASTESSDPQPPTQPADPQPQRSADTKEPQRPDPAPQAEAETSLMDRLEDGQEFEDGDCELLPSKPREQTPEAEASPEEATEPQASPQEHPQEASNTQQPDERPEPSIEETAMAAASPAQAAGVPDEDEEPFLSGGLLAPNLDEEDARQEAQAALFQVNDARLELLPFHVFEYECILEGGGNTREERGRVWVSAQSGVVVTDPGGTLIDDPGVPHERFQAKISPREAVSKATPRLEDQLETREELRDDYSETAIIERVTLTPRDGTLNLEHLGTAFAPRWRVEGQNGTVFVDALTGDLVSG